MRARGRRSTTRDWRPGDLGSNAVCCKTDTKCGPGYVTVSGPA